MTTENDREDTQWLASLAGRPDPTADPITNAQASALRNALQTRKAKLDAMVPHTDESQYQQLLFRLRQEGLTGKQNSWIGVMQWGRAKGQLAARVMTSHNTTAWAIAATAVLVIGVTLQMNLLQQGQDASRMHEAFRSGGTVLIEPNPKARAEELQLGLKATGTDTNVIAGPDGQFQLRFRSSAAALEYLNNQRIEPTEIEGFLTLTITAPLKVQ
jgi:hypothetical protein